IYILKQKLYLIYNNWINGYILSITDSVANESGFTTICNHLQQLETPIHKGLSMVVANVANKTRNFKEWYIHFTIDTLHNYFLQQN
ncbi:MAG: hypothetical protein ACRCXN_04385, partial [Bacteroidales bacterium]